MSSSVTRQIDFKTATFSFETVPSGLSITVNGTASTTPFSRTVIEGGVNSISAPSPQTGGSTPYAFASWSDGGAATHTITAGASATHTATYTSVPGLVDTTVADFSAGTTGANDVRLR